MEQSNQPQVSQEPNEDGVIKISEDVVAILADKAVRDVEGIAGMSGSLADSFAVVIGRKVSTKGIAVDIKDNDVVIHLHTVVKYGVRIPEVAWKAQEAVKTSVENMTGLNVLKVNISIEGVEFEKQEKEPPVDLDEELADMQIEEEPEFTVDEADITD
ncbi:MAG: Asp23/Gls24 family envelope stress response protein [Clostridia bacterium]|nr:Asp23/Gls24 family envelope stress response protein [Clostridia bacterium]